MLLTFRGITFDPAARQVLRGAQQIPLTRKAFDLLALLIDRRPEAVSKADIHARLWPGTFVAEITLHSLVSELRRALGDSSSEPAFIRTVHGFGYAFIGDADQAAGARRVRGWLIGAEGRLRLFDGDNVLGRGGDEDVVPLPSSTVSRRHAKIRFDDEAWLEDLGSKNGTFLEDVPVTGRVRLTDGHRVRLGSYLVTFRLAHGAGTVSTRTRTRSEMGGAGPESFP